MKYRKDDKQYNDEGRLQSTSNAISTGLVQLFTWF